jgi:uncharacterized protein (DUF2141 family)
MLSKRLFARRTLGPIGWGLLTSTLISSEGLGGPQAAEKTAATFDLSVEVNAVRSNAGRVAVALFDSRDAFPEQRKALRGALSKIDGARALVRFVDIEPGVYAVAVLHDENQNSKMDFNFLGMPLEGYGFSNDAAVTFGPPSFAEAAFRLRPRNSKIAIRMRYFGF